MGDQPYDIDLAAAQHPLTPPERLAEIAARRGDLHPLVLRHPACYPQLRDWILQVNPAARAATAAAPARRGRGGLCALLGCGGIALLGLALVAVLVVAGLALSPSAPSQPIAGGTSTREESAAAFEQERTAFWQLYAQIEENPVAPLVADVVAFRRWEDAVASTGITDASLANYAAQALTARQGLEQRIADAQTRRVNASGSVTESLVDDAGQGFIDISWDAATACATSRRADEGRTTIGCVSEDPLAVHLAPESQLGGDTGMRQVVLHELSHLYVRADSDAKGSQPSASRLLLDQGYFQGDSEVFADCYALTYLDLWTLTFEGRDTGYGYICTAEERQLMRTWAAEVHAPLP